ncbi:MAG: hypothetical protein IJ012_07930 [Clostridia bacterium]|nr:hypothetical protein [Clostridia bacterium]
MKKTLLAALAFILVLATVLTGTVLAADEETTAEPSKVADVKMVDAAHPIHVDGQMDEAYTSATPLYMDSFQNTAMNVWTFGVAYFVWSPTENAIYCFMIINDADIGPTKYNVTQGCYIPWNADSIELFIDFNEDGLVPEGGYGPYMAAGANYSRGFQYRIDGYTGKPSCLMVEEPDNFVKANPGWKHSVTGQAANVYNGTYHLNEETKKMENMLDSAMTEYFGWGYSEDDTKIGWGRKRTECGYTVEYRIECKERTLAVGDKVFFDVQGNDMYQAVRDSTNGGNLMFYYNSTLRKATGKMTASGTRSLYDWFVLSDEVAENDEIFDVNHDKMYEMGMEDVSEGRIERTEATKLTQTQKRTWSRRPTGATVTPGDGDNQQGGNQGGGDSQGGDNNQQGGNQGGDNTAEEPSGGCGSSITVGASIAMVAAVALGGAFAFRKKDEE